MSQSPESGQGRAVGALSEATSSVKTVVVLKEGYDVWNYIFVRDCGHVQEENRENSFGLLFLLFVIYVHILICC